MYLDANMTSMASKTLAVKLTQHIGGFNLQLLGGLPHPEHALRLIFSDSVAIHIGLGSSNALTYILRIENIEISSLGAAMKACIL